MELSERIKRAIVDVPDFPKQGIVFKDITPLLDDAELFISIIDHLRVRYAKRGVTKIVAIESRGFLFGAALGYAMGIGVELVRKPGKLPRETRSVRYELEYGSDELQIHADALALDDKVVIIDDLLATGGTAGAAAQLVESCGAKVDELAFVVELGFLEGRAKLGGRPVHSLVEY